MNKSDSAFPKNSHGKEPGAGANYEADGPVYNQRGIIAESYHDLQGLEVLASARAAYPLPKASGESALRAVFQAAEIALLNLTDLIGRAASDMDCGDLGSATVKMFWARGFHRLLSRLSMIPHQLAPIGDRSASPGVLRIGDSSAFQEYLQTLRRFDQSVGMQIKQGRLDIDNTVADGSLDSAAFNLIHLTRICNHESTIWERNLAEVHVPAEVPSYEEFVVAQGMYDAVYERELSGDTYFTQFRGLHQVPETLGEEINDHLEQAIRDVRSDHLPEAAEHLSYVSVLLEGVLSSLPPIADSLATSDYHRIRENLGLTSGSHSVSLRYHLFTHLYEQLWEEVAAYVTGRRFSECETEVIEDALRQAERDRFVDSHAWLVHLLVNHCLHLRACINQWRDQHLHLPRNNLGGEQTKSLTGSPDAVRAVKQMRDAAQAKDPMIPLARVRDLASAQGGQLTQYLESDVSLDNRILATIGHVTQSRFSDVQERLGYFSNRSSFSPPPRRDA
jgi:tryptophan 2,3-dioxygenase